MFFASRLNIFYLILEKMNGFAEEAKYDISNVPAAQIAQDYEEKRTDAWSDIESLSIVKRIISVCKFNNYAPYIFCLRGSFLQRGWSRRRVLRVRQIWGAKERHLRLRRLPIQSHSHVRYHLDLITRNRFLLLKRLRLKELLRRILRPSTLEQVLRPGDLLLRPH